MPEGGDATASFANPELLPVIPTYILKRKWRRTTIDQQKTRSYPTN